MPEFLNGIATRAFLGAVRALLGLTMDYQGLKRPLLNGTVPWFGSGLVEMKTASPCHSTGHYIRSNPVKDC
jgi:hypothetical protein